MGDYPVKIKDIDPGRLSSISPISDIPKLKPLVLGGSPQSDAEHAGLQLVRVALELFRGKRFEVKLEAKASIGLVGPTKQRPLSQAKPKRGRGGQEFRGK